MKKLAITLSVALFLITLISQPAFAAFIDQWEYTLTYSFASYENESGTQAGLTLSTDGNELSWGTGGTSSIGFIDMTGTVNTNSYVDILDHLYHDNQPINASSDTLARGSLSATLTLKGVSPASSTLASFSTVLDFLFFETSNRYGDWRDNDVFILKNPEAAAANFTYDGYDYAFSFSSGFNPILNPTLDSMDMAVGSGYRSVLDLLEDPNSDYYYDPDGPYIGWTTPESTLTYIDSTLTVVSRTTPVPEPSTFAFLGLGLLGLAFVGRKLRRAN